MNQLEVKICSGTTCFVMGSSYLDELFDIIPQKYGDSVIVKQSPCLNQCSKSNNHSSAPYVAVGDTIIANATIDKVIAEINNKVEKNEQ